MPCPVGEGNWVSLKSVEADSRRLWRSSKLTEGRKSNEPVVVSLTSFTAETPFLPPKEKSEWLLEDEALSIGPSTGGNRRTEPILVGLAFSFLLRSKRAPSASLLLSPGRAVDPGPPAGNASFSYGPKGKRRLGRALT